MPSESEARRCAAHNLAADAEGKCVVCRRALQPIAAEPAPPLGPPFESRLLTWVVAVLGSASLGAAIALRMVDAQDAAAARARASVTARASMQAAIDRTRPPAAAAVATAKPDTAREPERGAKGLAPEPKLPAATRPPPAPPPSAPTLGDQLKRERAEREAAEDAQRHAQVESELNQRALAAARRNVAVEMFSTSWCGVCTSARRYMEAQHISFVDHDIDQDPTARSRAQLLNPRLSVPILDVGGFVMIGFSERTLEDNLDRAAHKRVGL